MVVNNMEALKEALEKVEGKGDPIAAAGTTESGKSTSMDALASHPDVQELMGVREASGKGSTSEVSIIATDYEKIPENKLIMTAKLCHQTLADCNDDNDFLGNVMYAAAKDYIKNPSTDIYTAKMAKALTSSLEHPANESLAYKIKDMSEDDFNELFQIFNQFPINEVMIIYNEMMAKNPKKGQKGVRIFIELLTIRESFTNKIQDFWNFIVKLINRDVEQLKIELRDSGAYIDTFPDGSSKFIIVFGKEDSDSEIVKTLLKSEDGSKEYLLSDISLIFRGASYLFNVENVDLLTVSEYEGKQIHCIRFIDTQGLFHATGVKTKDESERIIDILSTYHSNKLMLVVNSFITDTVKDGYEAVRMMLQEANRDIEVYILYTHWDEYLKNYSQQKGMAGRFSRAKTKVDWVSKYDEAMRDQKELSNSFLNCLASNSSKKKPRIVGFYRAAILSDALSKMEDKLEEENIVYPQALNMLVTDVLREQSKNGPKHRVVEGIEKCFAIEVSNAGKQNISKLYDNLVVDCKGLKLYASTVRACNRKWCDSGTVHSSVVGENDYGFKNIETKFVQEIRNYAMTFVNKLVIDSKPYVSDSSDVEKFNSDLIEYLLTNQNVGREVARLIGKEAYREGFEKDTSFRYQYERFTEMIQYTQNNYFAASSIEFTDAFRECLTEAIQDCIDIFVDSKCIVVY